MLFKKEYPSPDERTKGINKKEFIILHHTWTWEGTINWVLDWLYRRKDYASCHFVINTNGDTYKIWTPDDILWHAGESQWGKVVGLNSYSIGIEVIWPLVGNVFTSQERDAVRLLVRHLCNTYNIPHTKILRHMDITSVRAGLEQLARKGDKCRKVDIADTFWNKAYSSFDEYRRSIFM